MAKASKLDGNGGTAVRRAVFVNSEKGGVGKSVTARALIDQLRTEGVRVAAYDADGGVGGLVRVLGTRDAHGDLIEDQDPVVGVGYYNVRAEAGRPTLVNCLRSGERLIVHDLAGGSLVDLMEISDQGDGLKQLLRRFDLNGYRITVLHLISAEVGATQSVARWIDLVGDRVDHVAVRNTRWGKSTGDFPFWHGFTDARGVEKGGKVRRRLLEELGGHEINLPAMPSGTFAKVDAENLAFSVAEDDPTLTIAEQSHVCKFREDFAAALEPIRPLLGL
jgi:hypothetical protein